MALYLRRAGLALSTALVGFVGGAVETVKAAPAWIESEGGCKIESLDPRPGDAFVWTGRCVDGYAEGHGVLTRNVDGKLAWTFRGSMKAGRQTGEGRLEFAIGDVYEGSFVDGRRTGQGSYVTSDSRYVGSFVDGAFTGRGRFVMRDGSDYQGELVDGNWEGEGTMRWFAGEVLKGRWKAGVAQSGEIIRTNGDRCSGNLQRNQLSGAGRCSWANGDTYEGEFVAGALDGQGDYKFRDGLRYKGAFKMGQPAGAGTLSRSGAAVYKGPFENGAPISVDGLVMADGRKAKEAEAPAILDGLKFEFAPPVQLPPVPFFARRICTRMGQPAMPKVETAWRGRALFKVVARVKNGSVVMVEITPLTSGVDRVAMRAMLGNLEATLRDTYECPGNHVFEMQFEFRI